MGNPTFIGTSGVGVWQSTDLGQTWNLVYSWGTFGDPGYGAPVVLGSYMVRSSGTAGLNPIYSGDGGKTWATITDIASVANAALKFLMVVNGQYMAGDATQLYASPTGAPGTWQPVGVWATAAGAAQTACGLYHVNGLYGYFAVNYLFTSPDLTTWTQQTDPAPNNVTYPAGMVYYGSNGTYAVARPGSNDLSTYYSTDGINWTKTAKTNSCWPGGNATVAGGAMVFPAGRSNSGQTGPQGVADGYDSSHTSGYPTTLEQNLYIRAFYGIDRFYAFATQNDAGGNTLDLFSSMDGIGWSVLTPLNQPLNNGLVSALGSVVALDPAALVPPTFWQNFLGATEHGY